MLYSNKFCYIDYNLINSREKLFNFCSIDENTFSYYRKNLKIKYRYTPRMISKPMNAYGSYEDRVVQENKNTKVQNFI